MINETQSQDERIIYLYRITNLVNQKVYIGQTVDPSSRWRAHRRDSAEPKVPFHFAIKKYGAHNFEFETIAACKSFADANKLETTLVKQYDSFIANGKGYNASHGGMNAPKSEAFKQMLRDYWADPEYKTIVSAAISEAYALQTPEEKLAKSKLLSKILQGKHLSPETEFKLGHQLSQESLEKLSKSMTGKFAGEKHHMFGTTMSEHVRQALLQSNIGREPWNKGTIGIMKSNSGSFQKGQSSVLKGVKGRKPNHCKLTVENVLEIVYIMTNKIRTKEELSEQFGIKERAIRNIMAGKTWNHITHINL